MSQRSKRLPEVSSPSTLLGAVEPAHRALNGAKAGLTIGGAHYQALERATEALDRLAAELGRPEHFMAKPPSRAG